MRKVFCWASKDISKIPYLGSILIRRLLLVVNFSWHTQYFS
jgi:hypothetical protein